MSNWIKQLIKPKEPVVHPPWETGQYVTYFFQRDDGSWLAIMLTITGKTEDGEWVIYADFKDEDVENRATITVDQNDRRPENLKLGRKGVLRGTLREFDPKDVKTWNRPEMNVTLALNLLFVRDYQSTANALQGKPHAADYACGIKEVYSIIEPAPGYMKHIDLNPRVVITGVVCEAVNGDKNPTFVTSFGNMSSGTPLATLYEDFVDFSHMTRIDHDGFSLTYPATWFLRLDGTRDGPLTSLRYGANAGGNTCSAGVSVTVHTGTRENLQKEREKVTARLKSGYGTPAVAFVPPKNNVLELEGGRQLFVLDMVATGIDGFLQSAWYDADDRLAQLTITGSVAKQNPRRKESLDEMERVFREIVASFQLT
jgi:hypothetical protein